CSRRPAGIYGLDSW
nr:immunoglobulin heavy chain junction region [Macaca mulatta]